MSDEMLGPIVLKALRGEYDTANDALKEARDLLMQGCGRVLSTSEIDELEGFEWAKEFHVEKVKWGTWEVRATRAACNESEKIPMAESLELQVNVQRRDPEKAMLS
ncbi:hypothetical protein LTS10_011764 [Elasticomyces elasticus]|nr:hypothetical protein LTS10_011764 [Elasticomyces elasticus]